MKASAIWANCATTSSKIKAKVIALRIFPPALLERFLTATSKRYEVPPLHFPEAPNALPTLLQLGVKEDYAKLLSAHFVNAVDQVDRMLYEQYYAKAPLFCGVNEGSRLSCVQASQSYLLNVRVKIIQGYWSALISHATSFMDQGQPLQVNPPANTSPTTSNCAPSSKRKRQGRPSLFTPEQTYALNALLERDDQFSSEEKDFIAQKLGLTRDQVNRWFCNARARKKPGSRLSRAGSFDSVRTVLSDVTHIHSNGSEQEEVFSETTNSTPETHSGIPAFAPVPELVFTPELAHSVYDVSYSSMQRTNAPSQAPHFTFAPQVTNSFSPAPQSTPETPELITPTHEADPLDAYIDYTAYLNHDQNSGDLNNTAPDLDMAPAMHTPSSQPHMPMTAPMDCSKPAEPIAFFGDSTEPFIDPLLNSLTFNPIQPFPNTPPRPPTPSLTSEIFAGYNLSEWGFSQ